MPSFSYENPNHIVWSLVVWCCLVPHDYTSALGNRALRNVCRISNKKSGVSMTKVITYGTYDLLHEGHIRLLRRAKELGDYLIVGVTADSFDKDRGKINVVQSLSERIDAIRATGLANEIIVEEYEGQKIEDVQRLDVDVFTVGSDWIGKFDYLNEYCEVVYLERTEGISSTELRSQKTIRLGFMGEMALIEKYIDESSFVNGLEISGICTKNPELRSLSRKGVSLYEKYSDLLACSDAVFIATNPADHASQIKTAIENGVHVLCESPISLSVKEYQQLLKLSEHKDIVLADAIKTAYATAYERMLLLAKSGAIGNIVSIHAACTSLRDIRKASEWQWGAIQEWGPTAALPIFQLFGTQWKDISFAAFFPSGTSAKDGFVHATLSFENAIASFEAGNSVKSEGALVISGTTGYIYVPAPWWKMDYFEIRRENASENKRYFYQLDGEGIRYELVTFARAIRKGDTPTYVSPDISLGIIEMMETFYLGENTRVLENISR